MLRTAHVLVLVVLTVSAPGVRAGESPVAQAQAVSSARLAEYEGEYKYQDDTRLFIVADGEGLVAIIGDGKYPLRRARENTFVNRSGSEIPFVRDASGRVAGFIEGGVTYTRLSPAVPTAVRRLLEPRPGRQDGIPERYTYTPPARLADGIAVGSAGQGTVPPSVSEQLVNGVIQQKYADVRAILVHHKDALRLEEYFYGYDRDRPHPMRSLTKTVITLLAGLAVDRGLVRADEPVFARLGYPASLHPDARKTRITLEHLLSNQSGLACDDRDAASPGNEVKIYDAPDWVKAFVDLPVAAEPGTVGRYCSAGFLAAGRLIERAAGTDLPTFARRFLFEPLGVAPVEWSWTFRPDRSQRNEFGQIYLRPRVMLKLGLLLKERGEWDGRRIMSAAWADAMMARQSRVDDSDYGLGVWHRWYQVDTPAGRRRVDTVMLSGNGGQKVYIVPSLDLIAVFTGGAFNAESPVNVMMAQALLPALLSGQAGPDAER